MDQDGSLTTGVSQIAVKRPAPGRRAGQETAALRGLPFRAQPVNRANNAQPEAIASKPAAEASGTASTVKRKGSVLLHTIGPLGVKA